MDATAQLEVIPWKGNEERFEPEVLEHLYADMESVDLLREVFHERVLSLSEFVHFANTELFSLAVDVERNQIAGFGWLSDIAQPEGLLRGWAGLALLPHCWKPRISTELGRLCMASWFNLGFDLILGLTPEPNRLARLWTAKMGMRYVATIPGYTSYHGKVVDGMVCKITREEFEARFGGSNG